MPLVCPLCGGAVSGRVGLRCASDGMAMCLPSLMPSKGDPLLGRVIGGRYPLVGLLGKVFGPIGFVFAACSGELPWSFGLVIVTNDLVWWWPFTAILLAARAAALTPPNRLARGA